MQAPTIDVLALIEFPQKSHQAIVNLLLLTHEQADLLEEIQQSVAGEVFRGRGEKGRREAGAIGWIE